MHYELNNNCIWLNGSFEYTSVNTFVDFIVGKRGNPLSCSEGNGSIGMDSSGGEIALNGIRMGSSCVASWE